jgi:hypothetical protein
MIVIRAQSHCYAEWHYTKCPYDECRGAAQFTLHPHKLKITLGHSFKRVFLSFQFLIASKPQ